ncbi:Ribosome biogenesis protein-like protein [Hapsidospora chrysogenum ATCC 11550]|uniref:Ribosome biogenesis protein-like protein n=1 Tax=Hapsidospora chrysogenum (strain ATCC 11550 / CBS 779.69 / DSM 880 / IAM 14645 / JCM 23072 / IMI 49137) TaxID=857340 RepID=A0A086TAL8_HAPC1|nr:Ribosome biogenesis protein-like protein [Hapsidospora chrysogenum ATCC 11550]
MKLSNPGTVPVYTVSGASTARPLPDWLARRRKRSLKNDPEYQNRVELLQDFEFEEASNCIRVSEDGDWAMSTGTYKPQIHVHNLPQLSLSFARHTTSLNHSFVLLSRDYSKSLHLQIDRKLEFHTPMGCHYEVRLPRYGRDLIYDRLSTEALVPSVGLDADGKGEVFRMNLELGRFMRSYQVDVGGDDPLTGGGLQGGVNVGSVNVAAIAEQSHNLLAFGTSIGTIEFWDPRSKSRVALLAGNEGEVTALDFSISGLSLATGSSTGMMQIFDMRRPIPLLKKDHGYGFPVKKLIHMTTASQEKKIMSSDKRIIKIWDEANGDPWTSVEPVVDINDVAWCKDTGMILTANEGKQQHAFFVPQLGPAPKWCAFLDNLVEEMAEESRTETYDNYKFLTLPELKQLSLAHLVGKTNLLRPYMHGYFVASKLYDQARLITNPYMFEEERMKRVKEKVEKERSSRIRGSKKVKVNQNVVDRLLKKQQNRDKVDTNAGILGDERFKALFEDPEFQVDENSREFQALNPSTYIDQNADPNAPTRYQAQDSEDESSSAEESIDEITGEPKPREDVVMRVSSTQNRGGRIRDTALGSRQHKNNRERTQRREVVGDQQVTFTPDRRKERQEEEAQPAQQRPRGNRRSASSNTFRRM